MMQPFSQVENILNPYYYTIRRQEMPACNGICKIC